MMATQEAHQQEPLCSVESEASLIATLLCHNRLVDIVADTVSPEDFSDPLHGRFYDAILNLTARGLSASPITMFPLFQGDEVFQQLGGMGYFSALTAQSIPIGVRENAEQVADFAARRRLIEALKVTSDSALDANTPLAEIVDASDAALVAAIEKRDPWKVATGSDCLGMAISRINAIKANDGKMGCTTGILDIDLLLGGFEPGQVVIVAGRPGMGKTAVACSTAIGLARGGAGVLFLSLEMKSEELGMRMAADLAFDGRRGILFDDILNARLTSDQVRDLIRTQERMQEWPLAVVDQGTVTVSRLALGIRRAKRRFAAKGQQLKVVVVDYLQLLHVDQPGRKSQYEVVSEISRSLKALAKDTDVTIIALAQLSREVEKRDDKRPQLSDLRDSGQIEQDADAVMFLYREEYYLEKKKRPKGDEAAAAHDAALTDARSRIDFIVAKRRNGRVGERNAFYFPHYQAVRGSDLYDTERRG